MVCVWIESSIRGFFERSRRRFKPRSAGGGHSVAVPEHLDWLIWRLVVNKIASLSELNTHYDIVELFAPQAASYRASRSASVCLIEAISSLMA